jgi:hypothetical protein
MPLLFSPDCIGPHLGIENKSKNVCQAAIDEETGLLEVVSPPLSSLLKGGQEPPNIMGNLVPQAINMWMGSSVQGDSISYFSLNAIVSRHISKLTTCWTPPHPLPSRLSPLRLFSVIIPVVL